MLKNIKNKMATAQNSPDSRSMLIKKKVDFDNKQDTTNFIRRNIIGTEDEYRTTLQKTKEKEGEK